MTPSTRWGLLLILLSITYFFAVMLPEIQSSNTHSGRMARSLKDDMLRLANPTGKLDALRGQLDFSDTFANRHALGRECFNCGLYDEAIEHYQRCLTGVHADNPGVQLDLAYAYCMSDDFDDALTVIKQLMTNHSEYRRNEVALLHARALEEYGSLEDALEAYQKLLRFSTDFEARCRYGMLLREVGHVDEAIRVFRQLDESARRSDRDYRRRHKTWIKLAETQLNEIQQTEGA